MTTRKDIRLYLYDEIPQLGFSANADSVAAGAIVDAYNLADTGLSTKHFRGTTIYRPTATDPDDIVRKSGDLTVATGSLAHTGGDYIDQTTVYYELVGYLHPDDLNACIQRAQRKVYFETQTVCTEVTDGDMEASGVTNWTDINGDETASKVTAAANVRTGTQAIRVQNATVNGGVQSDAIDVHPAEPVRVSAVVRSDSGTPSLILYDETNGAAIATITPTTDPNRWIHLEWEGLIPSGCVSVTVRLVGAENDADLFWDNAIFYHKNTTQIIAPSWLDEPWKFLKLRQVDYRVSLENYVNDESSRVYMDWSQPNHFSLDPLHRAANPYVISIKRPIRDDLWISGQRPYYDVETLAADTDTSSAPFLLLISYAKLELAELLMKRYPNDPQWEALRNMANQEIKAEELSRPEIPDTPKKTYLLGRI